MALRPEKKQINYQSQIGVTRGRGFQAMASAGQNRANALDSISEAYSERALKYIKEKGTALGETAAQDAKFVDQEISFVGEGGVKQTVKTRGVLEDYEPVTRSEQEAYDNNIAKRYANENYLAIASSLNEDRLQAITSNSSGSQYAIIAEAHLAAVLDSDVLPPKTKALLEIQAREKMFQDINSIEINYAKHVKKQIETNSKNDYDTIANAYRMGEDVSQDQLDDLYNSSYYEANKQDVDNKIKAYQFYGNIMSSISISSNPTIEEAQQHVDDINMLQLMIQGGTKADITLSSGMVIKKSDVLTKIPTDTLTNTLLTKSRALGTAAQKKLEMLKTEGTRTNVIASIANGQMSDHSNKDLAEAYDPNNQMLQEAFRDTTGGIDASLEGDVGEIWYYNLTGVIPEKKANLLDNLVASRNYKELYKHHQFLIKLSNNEGIRIDADGNQSIETLDLLAGTNLDSETIALLRQIEIGRRTGYPEQTMIERFKDRDDAANQGLKMNYEKYGNNVKTSTERNELITEGIEDYVKGIYKKSNIDVSPAFIAGVKKEITSYEMRNLGVEVGKKLYKEFITMALESIDHKTSSYGASDTTVGMNNQGSTISFVQHDAHKLYAVNGSSDWINPIIQKSIDESSEIKRLNVDGKKVSANFRKEVKLSPAGSGEPMFYHLYFKDSTGKYRTLNDDNGLIVIDLSKELLKKTNKLNSSIKEAQEANLNKLNQDREDYVEGKNG